MKKTAALLITAAVLCSCQDAGSTFAKILKSLEEYAESIESDEAEDAEKVVEDIVEEAKPIGYLHEHDFILKYTKYGYSSNTSLTQLTRNPAGDKSYEITKDGDTFTVIEHSTLDRAGRVTETKTYKQIGDNVQITSSRVCDDNPAMNEILNKIGSTTSTKVREGKTVEYFVSSWFNSSPHDKGEFVLGSRDPRYMSEEQEVKVTDGEPMFGRTTKVYTGTTKKGGIIDMSGRSIGSIRICDAEQFGIYYVCYRSISVVSGQEYLAFEVTDFKILK